MIAGYLLVSYLDWKKWTNTKAAFLSETLSRSYVTID